MKMITAIIQPYRLDHVCAALSEVGILGVSVTECHSGEAYGNNLVAKVMLQLVVPADKITTVTGAIITGVRGPGKSAMGMLEDEAQELSCRPSAEPGSRRARPSGIPGDRS